MTIIIEMCGIEEDKDGEILSYLLVPKTAWVIWLLKAFGVALDGGNNQLFQPRRAKNLNRGLLTRIHDAYCKAEDVDRDELLKSFPKTGNDYIIHL
jgi:hypothetical protein